MDNSNQGETSQENNSKVKQESDTEEVDEMDSSTKSRIASHDDKLVDEASNEGSSTRKRDAEKALVKEDPQDDMICALKGAENSGKDGVGNENLEEKDATQQEKKSAPGEKASTKSTESEESAKKEQAQIFPARPIKKARTAYFIFADDKRPEVQAKNPGEGVTVIARALGQLWQTLSEEDRAVYQEKAAEERERVAQELAKYNLDGIEIPKPTTDPNSLIFPVARIRKICKLDQDVSNLSKEATMLITKCAELATIHLGLESMKVAQLQNRRKLLPEDVAQVCATREQFLFLREDVKDLVREQKVANQSNKASGGSSSLAAAATNSKPLTS
eukprot:CAMPEP_0178907442 /NCGR_PEP_ID=MMETSP0786-20121207/7375_1 /TAXON_ID=186022 /ORGANISM="Thalassionema frauenfeldii, Strain CCMP 1798" /LENGTH=331 /DNA_ID=CAMNT_0020579245 /DNA_START=57 /DNA_END=1052 /DNA_ORIENTATION=-